MSPHRSVASTCQLLEQFEQEIQRTKDDVHGVSTPSSRSKGAQANSTREEDLALVMACESTSLDDMINARKEVAAQVLQARLELAAHKQQEKLAR